MGPEQTLGFPSPNTYIHLQNPGEEWIDASMSQQTLWAPPPTPQKGARKTLGFRSTNNKLVVLCYDHSLLWAEAECVGRWVRAQRVLAASSSDKTLMGTQRPGPGLSELLSK